MTAAEFTVDTIEAHWVTRLRGTGVTRVDRVAVWACQHPTHRGLPPAHPLRGTSTPTTVELWSAGAPYPDRPRPVPDFVDLAAALAPAQLHYLLRGLPEDAATTLSHVQQLEPGLAHEGYRVNLWLDPTHAAGSGGWAVVVLHRFALGAVERVGGRVDLRGLAGPADLVGAVAYLSADPPPEPGPVRALPPVPLGPGAGHGRG